tara:strand:+ start:28556 stop:28765 length:210 start_codon:yes stop_codon:yes gene_type:complete
MHMPETAMYQYNGMIFGEYKIWRAWQLAAVQPVTEATGMQNPSDQHFRLCVFTPDCRHIPAAGRRRVNV